MGWETTTSKFIITITSCTEIAGQKLTVISTKVGAASQFYLQRRWTNTWTLEIKINLEVRQKGNERGSKKKETKKEATIKIKKGTKRQKNKQRFRYFCISLYIQYSMRVIFTFAPGIKQDADFVVILVSKHWFLVIGHFCLHEYFILTNKSLSRRHNSQMKSFSTYLLYFHSPRDGVEDLMYSDSDNGALAFLRTTT